jgi:hypothetical protein
VAANTAKVWTAEEDDRLRGLVAADADLVDIAKSLGRTEKAVKARSYILRLSLRRIGVRRRGLSKWG